MELFPTFTVASEVPFMISGFWIAAVCFYSILPYAWIVTFHYITGNQIQFFRRLIQKTFLIFVKYFG